MQIPSPAVNIVHALLCGNCGGDETLVSLRVSAAPHYVPCRVASRPPLSEFELRAGGAELLTHCGPVRHGLICYCCAAINYAHLSVIRRLDTVVVSGRTQSPTTINRGGIRVVSAVRAIFATHASPVSVLPATRAFHSMISILLPDHTAQQLVLYTSQRWVL
jgi:hypothetical protein